MNKNRDKNGFVFIETIIAIIILIVAFLTLFNIYNKLYRKIDSRYEYDNISFIYKARNTKKALENYSDFKATYKELVNDNKLITNIGIETTGIGFSNKESYMKVLDTLQVSNVYLIKDFKKYKEECVNKYNQELCNYIYFDNNMSDYLNSIKNKDLTYILLIETRLKNNGTNCFDNVTNSSDVCAPKYTYLELNYD